MKNILQIIKTRRSVRKYRNSQIKDSELDAIIQAGRYAPSGGNNQKCHLLVVQNKEVLDKLKALACQEFSEMELAEDTYKSLAGAIKASKKGNYDFTYGAPTIIIVANEKKYGNAMADSACLLENMMIAAHALSLGTCWLNQLHWLTENSSMRTYLEALGMTDKEFIYGALAIGYADIPQQPPLARHGNHVSYIK